MEHRPIQPDEFSDLMRRIRLPQGPIAVAVSGGPDSMALAFCLGRLVGAGHVQALIVEHGLRPESAAEAKFVADRLQALGFATQILPWCHGLISSRVHVQARRARYGLLTAACRELGVKTLCLAHHADDQAETILMRFSKGSGIDGLAGMEPASELDGVHLVRPLLTVAKARLTATCEANGVPFVIDPSNDSIKYARGRLRRVMPLLAQEGLTAERLVDLSDRAREAKMALDFYTAQSLSACAEILSGGAVRLDLPYLRGLPRAIAMRVVVRALSNIHRIAYPPERKAMLGLMAWLLAADDYDARTLHGCLIQKGEVCDKAIIMREAGAILDHRAIGAGQTLLWDGRWQVSYHGREADLYVRALGGQTHERIDGLAPALRDRVRQGRVRACLPALWRGEELVAIPSFSEAEQSLAHAAYLPFDWA